MTRLVASAYMEMPGGVSALVGTFQPRRPEDWRRELNVAEPRPMMEFVAGPPRPVDEVIKTHAFPVVHLHDGRGGRTLALRVKPGDPVEWLRDWTWCDPMWRAIWRGERPDPSKPHIIDLATGRPPGAS